MAGQYGASDRASGGDVVSRENAARLFGEALVARALASSDDRRLTIAEAKEFRAVVREGQGAPLERIAERAATWAIAEGDDRLLATVRFVVGGVDGELEDMARDDRGKAVH
jgi:hypothetical protein